MDDDASERRWWHLDLLQPCTPTLPWLGLTTRAVERGDDEVLAVLMLDAYAGTIDSEGETIVEAREEIAGWFAKEGDDALVMSGSLIAFDVPRAVSAVLLHRWEDDEVLVGYVITAADRKGTGLANLLLGLSLDVLKAAGIAKVRAAITVGNTPSERLFTTAGFHRGDAITD